MSLPMSQNKVYLTRDNIVLWGEETSLIDQLRASAWDMNASRERYMKAVARRCRVFNGSKIRHDTPENFINDLISGGFIVKYDLN